MEDGLPVKTYKALERNAQPAKQSKSLAEYVDRLRAQCSPPQLDFIESKAKRKVACCSRRSGKTQALIRYLLMVALRTPKAMCMYLAATRVDAKRLVWTHPEGLCELIRTMGIPAEFNESDLLIYLPNGSQIRVGGFETRADAARLKGDRYDLVVIDECQDMADELLTYLQRTVVGPMLMDRDGTRCMAGTPGAVPAGWYWGCSTGDSHYPGWSRFTWTFRDNPFVDGEAWFERELADGSYSPDDAFVQREYFGRWVRDENELLFRYSSERNDGVGDFPVAGDWAHVLGVDIGARDASAFVVGAYSLKHPVAFIRDCERETGADVTRVAQIIQSFMARYPGIRVVMDSANLQAAIELRNRHGLPIEAAEKVDKATYIMLMNDDLRRSRLRVDPQRCKDLIGEWNTIRIDPRHAVDPKKRIEEPSARCDLADAALYAWRHMYAYLYSPAMPKPERASLGEKMRRSGWAERLEAEMRREAETPPAVLAEEREDAEFWRGMEEDL